MNELTNLTSSLQQLPLFYIGIGVLFLLLLLTKNNFTQPPNLTHKNHTLFIVIFTFIFAILPAGYFGWGFYQLYFPNYKYEEISAAVNFHIYRPKYLPPNIKQITAFQLTDKAIFSDPNTIRATYSYNLSHIKTSSSDGKQMVIIDQKKVVEPFSLITFNQSVLDTVEPSGSILPHNLTAFPNSPAFSITNSAVSMLWLRTKDNVLIILTSPSSETSLEELIKIAESLY